MSKLFVPGPGIYPDLSAPDYHADPVFGGSLSSTGARKILPPGCPARFRHDSLHPPKPKDHFDLGQAAHHMLLQVGPQPVELDFPDRRTNAYKAQAAEARAAGHIPLLPEQMGQVQAMASALLDNPVARRLFDPDTGRPEISMVWQDTRTAVMRRARLDFLSTLRLPDGRLVIPDYKTADSAEPEKWMKAAVGHGYHQQACWYLDAVAACGIVDDPSDAVFLFIVQEKVEPYIVSVLELDHIALMWGGYFNDRALDIYRACSTAGRWPGYVDRLTGYPDGVAMPPFPKYAEYAADEITERDIRT